MVGVVVECRLGNQLFQYAFIKALSQKFNTSFFLNNKNNEKFIASKYFTLKGYNPVTNFLYRAYFKLKNGPFTTLQSTAIGPYNKAAFTALSDYKIYSGYFQSEDFFKNIAGSIPSYIRIKEKFKNQFNLQYQDTFANNRIIAVHVRRGDYLELNNWWSENLGSNDLSLPVNYYLLSMLQIKDIESYKIIFVSDDIEFVKSEFAHVKNAIFANNEMIIDFQILINADICIISNSSFSWWAAYLNQKPNKQIFCPQYWLGFKIKKEYPEYIIPSGWIQMAT